MAYHYVVYASAYRSGCHVLRRVCEEVAGEHVHHCYDVFVSIR